MQLIFSKHLKDEGYHQHSFEAMKFIMEDRSIRCDLLYRTVLYCTLQITYRMEFFETGDVMALHSSWETRTPEVLKDNKSFSLSIPPLSSVSLILSFVRHKQHTHSSLSCGIWTQDQQDRISLKSTNISNQLISFLLWDLSLELNSGARKRCRHSLKAKEEGSRSLFSVWSCPSFLHLPSSHYQYQVGSKPRNISLHLLAKMCWSSTPFRSSEQVKSGRLKWIWSPVRIAHHSHIHFH